MEVRSELLTEATEATEATVISPDDLPNDADTWLNYNFKDNWTSEVYPLIQHDPVFEYLIKEELTDFVYQMVYFDNIEMPMPPDDWDIWTDSPVNYNLPHPQFYPYNDNVEEWLDGDSDEAYEALEKLHKLDHSSPEFDIMYKRLIVSNGPKPNDFRWFMLRKSCHWLSIGMHRAFSLLRPENEVKVVKGDKHTCVVDLTQKQVFDILLSNANEEGDTNSIEFVKELKAVPKKSMISIQPNTKAAEAREVELLS